MMIPHFSTLGSGKTTVLMLHGAEGSHLSFAPQLETLAAAGYRAVAWDMPGYGSSAPVEPYNFKALSAQCIALIEALRSKELVLVGHGMGAALAVEVMLRQPQCAHSLVLINPLLMHTPEMNNALASVNIDLNNNAPPSMGIYAERVIAQRVGSGHLPEGVKLLTHAFSQVPLGTYRRALEALLAFDRISQLSQITCPCLLVTGEQDAWATPSGTQALAAALGAGMSSDVLVQKGIGHYAHLEAPDEFDAALLNWLALPQALADDAHRTRRVLH